ncbi:hypothetical protein A2U01_0076701, partial [Trifolium medium]|nr:hypothetical protein [Trifolium medium]
KHALWRCSGAYNALQGNKLYLHAFVAGGTVSCGVLATVLHAVANAFAVDYLGLILSAHVVFFPSISLSLFCIDFFPFDITLCPFDHFLH